MDPKTVYYSAESFLLELKVPHNISMIIMISNIVYYFKNNIIVGTLIL